MKAAPFSREGRALGSPPGNSMKRVTCQRCSDSSPTRVAANRRARNANQPGPVERRLARQSSWHRDQAAIHMSQRLDTLWDVPPLRAVNCSASNHLLVAGTSAYFSLFWDGVSPGDKSDT